MDVIDEVIDESTENVKHFIETLKVSKHPIEISSSVTAELLLGRCDLSQRGYKSLRTILEKNNVKIPRYENVRGYCNELVVGEVKNMHSNNEKYCPCMGITCNVFETLQLIVSNEKLFKLFYFQTEEEQNLSFKFLKEKNKILYRNLDEKKRTIIIRVTGDNFRASARMPTEQTSFSIINIRELLNCPYGQFITTLWRGSESREMIETHLSVFFDEVIELVQNGVTLNIDSKEEQFNVICFFVADLCFVKDVIGQCTCTSLYGCYHCTLKSSEWISAVKKKGNPKTIEAITKFGVEAVRVLGKNPDKSSAAYTNFQQSHFGQWV